MLTLDLQWNPINNTGVKIPPYKIDLKLLQQDIRNHLRLQSRFTKRNCQSNWHLPCFSCPTNIVFLHPDLYIFSVIVSILPSTSPYNLFNFYLYPKSNETDQIAVNKSSDRLSAIKSNKRHKGNHISGLCRLHTLLDSLMFSNGH